jgi:ribosomal protein L12E/L44/L45/RPP1/RPP2
MNLEEEEIVDDLTYDGNASVPAQVKRHNPWKKKKKKKKKEEEEEEEKEDEKEEEEEEKKMMK